MIVKGTPGQGAPRAASGRGIRLIFDFLVSVNTEK